MPSFDMVVRIRDLNSGDSHARSPNHEEARSSHSSLSQTLSNEDTVSSDSNTRTKPSRLIRSRRRRYLEQNPSYFVSASNAMELSDPLLYDRLIRQHQSAAEREVEGKARGWGATLEASLLRSEAKLEEVRENRNSSELEVNTQNTYENAATRQRRDEDTDWTITPIEIADARNEPNQDAVKAYAQAQWQARIAERFVQGWDEDFDYSVVDGDEQLDGDEGVKGSWTERRREEQWFDEEAEDPEEGSAEDLAGETGVQDF